MNDDGLCSSPGCVLGKGGRVGLEIARHQCREPGLWSIQVEMRMPQRLVDICIFCMGSARNRKSEFSAFVDLFYMYIFSFVGC